MGVKEIEKVITQLSAKDVDRLANWLEEYRAQMWDKQIEKDLEEGRLDAVLAEKRHPCRDRLVCANNPLR